jgi:hypothetical protein
VAHQPLGCLTENTNSFGPCDKETKINKKITKSWTGLEEEI